MNVDSITVSIQGCHFVGGNILHSVLSQSVFSFLLRPLEYLACVRSTPLLTMSVHACHGSTSNCSSKWLLRLQLLVCLLSAVSSPPQARSPPGLAVSTHSWTRPMPRTTSPSLLRFLNISQPPGHRSTSICRCWSSCSLSACTTASPS